ncbi:MAG: hypothetical protein ACKOW3_09885 [Hyphomicrobium sp.]
MSLIRTLAIICIGIALIPSDKAQQERFQQSAIDLVYWTVTFCERNVYTCHVAEVSWDEFKQKAQFALDVGHELLMQQVFKKQLIVSEESNYSNKDKKSVNIGTLQPTDLAPEWRQNTLRKDIKVGINLRSD